MKAFLLAAPALVFGLAGCFDRYGFRHYQPDARPTAGSGEILVGYADGRMDPRAAELRAAHQLCQELRQRHPGQAPAGVPAPPNQPLAGPVAQPWTEPPHTVLTESPATPPAGKPGEAASRPAGGELIAAGDELEVQVARHPEFSGRWQVDAQGRLRIPLGGAFGPGLLPPAEFARRVEPAAGQSFAGLAAAVARELTPYVKSPPEVIVAVGARRGG